MASLPSLGADAPPTHPGWIRGGVYGLIALLTVAVSFRCGVLAHDQLASWLTPIWPAGADSILACMPVLGTGLLLALVPLVRDYAKAGHAVWTASTWPQFVRKLTIPTVMLALAGLTLGMARMPEPPTPATFWPSQSIGVAVRLGEIRFEDAALVNGQVSGPGVEVSAMQQVWLRQMIDGLAHHCRSGHLEIHIIGFPSDRPFRGVNNPQSNETLNLTAAHRRAMSVYTVLAALTTPHSSITIVEPRLHDSWDAMARQRDAIRRFHGLVPSDVVTDSDRMAILLLGGGSICPTWPFMPLAPLIAHVAVE